MVLVVGCHPESEQYEGIAHIQWRARPQGAVRWAMMTSGEIDQFRQNQWQESEQWQNSPKATSATSVTKSWWTLSSCHWQGRVSACLRAGCHPSREH